jgi:hypothetical protein
MRFADRAKTASGCKDCRKIGRRRAQLADPRKGCRQAPANAPRMAGGRGLEIEQAQGLL